MPKLKLRVINPQIEHPKEIAKRRVRAYKYPKQSITNIHGPEESRAPYLDVEGVLERANIRHMLGKK